MIFFIFFLYKLYDMTKTFVICIFLSVLCTLLRFGKACGPSEYKSAVGECCPMCNIVAAEILPFIMLFCYLMCRYYVPDMCPRAHQSMPSGLVVLRDCTGDLSTSCQPCASETFMNKPNGLHKCIPCKTCAESQGLYIQSKCTTISDTICDVLDGYYCKDYYNSQCLRALKHSVCAPGQETKSQGTKTSDTVCMNCALGFYSPSGLNCIKWTNCTARNEIETEKGTSEKDVTCTPKIRGRYGLIFAVVLTPSFYIILLLILQSRSSKLKHPIEETTPANTPQHIEG